MEVHILRTVKINNRMEVNNNPKTQMERNSIVMNLSQQMKEHETQKFHPALKMSETVSPFIYLIDYSIACYFGSLI